MVAKTSRRHRTIKFEELQRRLEHWFRDYESSRVDWDSETQTREEYLEGLPHYFAGIVTNDVLETLNKLKKRGVK